MTASEARAIADEQIAYWQQPWRWDGRACGHPMQAFLAWRLLSDRPYPGGGWERVRALMIEWLLLHDGAAAELRRAA